MYQNIILAYDGSQESQHGMLSADVLSRLSMEIRSILQSTELKQRFEKLGVSPGVMSQSEFAAYVDEEIKQWAYVVAQEKIQKQK